MISLIAEIIKKHPEWLRSSEAQFSFVKMSTPISGVNLVNGGGKVLIFVFEQGESTPTICVKTVRSYLDKEIIKDNYCKLQLLHEGVRDCKDNQIFAKPLYFYDDGEFVFYLESVCPGVAFSARESEVSFVVEKYGDWQRYLSRQSKQVWDPASLKNLVNDLIKKFNLPDHATSDILGYYEKISFGFDFRLPMIIQHGDMTPDNVIVSGRDIYLIDYDFVGLSQLPGFDLFNFLLKLKRKRRTFRSYYEVYFPLYFKAINANIDQYENLFFIYYLYELERKWKREERRGGEDIIAEFSRLIEK